MAISSCTLIFSRVQEVHDRVHDDLGYHAPCFPI